MKIYDESLYCQECNCEISVAQSNFCNDYCDECYSQAFQDKQGFFVGQNVYERDTFAPGVITAIDEYAIATVQFTNGSMDGISLEHLTTERVF